MAITHSDIPAATPSYRAGSGPPLVLLHGINASWRVWEPVLGPLAEHFDVLAPTAPGHRGGPPLADGEVSIASLADGIEQLLDAAGITEAHLAGNSLGGWLAIELGRRGRALSVTALSPAGAWIGPRDLRRVVKLLTRARSMVGRTPKLLAWIIRRPKLRRMALLGAMEHGERVEPVDAMGMLADVTECAAFVPFATWIAEQKSLAAAVDEQPYPITVAWGARDRTIPFKRYGVPMLEALPGARSVSLPGVGHVPMWDDPELIVSTILDTTAPTPQPRSITPR